MVLYGYRVNEVGLEEVVIVDFLPKISRTAKRLLPCDARPVSRSLPAFIVGLALPRVDFTDMYSNIFGLSKRVLRSPLKVI